MNDGLSRCVARVPRGTRHVVAAVALVLLGLTVYAPVFTARLLAWDDAVLVTHNYRIQQLSAARVADIFRVQPRYGPQAFNLYVPLVELSVAIEYRLAGSRPRIYHTTNIVLHLINALLVWRLLRALGVSGAAAWLGAAVFAVHPLQVESVAWVAQRKNVLCGLFFFLSMILHVRWRRTRHGAAYWAGVLTGVCALMSKPAAVTLPAVLLAYDVWYERRRIWPALARQAPVLVCAAVIAAVTYGVQHQHGAAAHPLALAWRENIGVACRGLWWYVVKFVAPYDLGPVYVRDALMPMRAWLIAGWLLGAAALLAIIAATRRRAPLMSLGLAWYVIVSIPTLQLVPAGLQISSADRFFYLPSVGLLLAACVLWQQLRQRARTAHVALCAACLALAVWTYTARSYARVWHDDVTLWRHAHAREPQLMLARRNLAVALYQAGECDAALPMLRDAARQQDDYRVLTLLATASLQRDDAPQALAWAERAVAQAPHATEARLARGAALSALGRCADATSDWHAVLARQPLHPDVHHRLAYDLLALGDTNGAIAAFEEHLTRQRLSSHPGTPDKP